MKVKTQIYLGKLQEDKVQTFDLDGGLIMIVIWVSENLIDTYILDPVEFKDVMLNMERKYG